VISLAQLHALFGSTLITRDPRSTSRCRQKSEQLEIRRPTRGVRIEDSWRLSSIFPSGATSQTQSEPWSGSETWLQLVSRFVIYRVSQGT
jgi:hypothetical protein